jgi:hypothetical protein
MGNFLSKPVEEAEVAEKPSRVKTRHRNLRRRGTARRAKKQEEESSVGD